MFSFLFHFMRFHFGPTHRFIYQTICARLKRLSAPEKQTGRAIRINICIKPLPLKSPYSNINYIKWEIKKNLYYSPFQCCFFSPSSCWPLLLLSEEPFSTNVCVQQQNEKKKNKNRWRQHQPSSSFICFNPTEKAKNISFNYNNVMFFLLLSFKHDNIHRRLGSQAQKWNGKISFFSCNVTHRFSVKKD